MEWANVAGHRWECSWQATGMHGDGNLNMRTVPELNKSPKVETSLLGRGLACQSPLHLCCPLCPHTGPPALALPHRLPLRCALSWCTSCQPQSVRTQTRTSCSRTGSCPPRALPQLRCRARGRSVSIEPWHAADTCIKRKGVHQQQEAAVAQQQAFYPAQGKEHSHHTRLCW